MPSSSWPGSQPSSRVWTGHEANDSARIPRLSASMVPRPTQPKPQGAFSQASPTSPTTTITHYPAVRPLWSSSPEPADDAHDASPFTACFASFTAGLRSLSEDKSLSEPKRIEQRRSEVRWHLDEEQVSARAAHTRGHAIKVLTLCACVFSPTTTTLMTCASAALPSSDDRERRSQRTAPVACASAHAVSSACTFAMRIVQPSTRRR